ncbi:hypothetical protein [Actinomadura roseirufa]|uniref:hypothetical protein n=1 Tax=Actinomadura roseirufa TaxID=2094049 RepID=UPI001041418F|nr:hypothetical protein [Actinomadura roseirufa]
MNNTLIKSAPSWAPARLGFCDALARVSARADVSSALSGEPYAAWRPSTDDGGAFGVRLRGLRDLRGRRSEQRVQDERGRTVIEHLLDGSDVQAPATAHKGATPMGDASGPYPWRRPV